MKKIYIKPKMRVIDDEMFDLCQDGAITGVSKGGQSGTGAEDDGENLNIGEGGEDDDAGAKGTQLWDDLSGW